MLPPFTQADAEQFIDELKRFKMDYQEYLKVESNKLLIILIQSAKINKSSYEVQLKWLENLLTKYDVLGGCYFHSKRQKLEATLIVKQFEYKKIEEMINKEKTGVLVLTIKDEKAINLVTEWKSATTFFY